MFFWLSGFVFQIQFDFLPFLNMAGPRPATGKFKPGTMPQPVVTMGSVPVPHGWNRDC